MMIHIEKLEVLEHCLESLIVIITSQQEPMMNLQGKKNIQYKSKGDRYKNLSPENSPGMRHRSNVSYRSHTG